MMFLPTKSSWLWLLGAVCLLLAGCSNKDAPAVSEGTAQLMQIYELHAIYVKKNQAPPQQWSDLNQKTYSELYPIAYNALQAGTYVLVWGVRNKDSSTLLAYPKDALTAGGEVVMADGTIKTLSAEQIQTALNANK